MVHLYKYLIVLFSVIILAGCSTISDSGLTPPNGNALTESENPLMVGVTDRFTDGSASGGMGTLGVFELNLNASDVSAELNPIRTSLSADVLEVVDITNFLRMAPCFDCVKIRSIALDADGNLVVSIGVKHPFGAGDPLKPITGRNRADLHVFNVEGIVVSDAAGTIFGGLNSTVAGFKLVNADGLTGYLDSAMDEIFPTDATLHPYVLHFDDYTAGNYDPANLMGFLSVTDPPPSGNLVMPMGCDYDYKDYVFDIPGGNFSFIYAVGCTYAVSADTKNQRFSPEYRCPQHNKKAASEVWTEIISNDLKGEDVLSTAQMNIHVVDISNGIAVGEGFGEMRADSSVDDILINIPGVMTDLLVIDGNNPVSGTGHSHDDPLIYAATITNTSSAVEGTYQGLIKVTDSYPPALNESPLLDGMDGIKRVSPIENPLTGLFDISDFATYQIFTIDIATGNTPPVAVLASNPAPATITAGNVVALDASGSSDLEDDLAMLPLTYAYLWNYSGDPLEFVTPDYGPTDEETVDTDTYDIPGDYTAAVKVTDSQGLYDIDTIDVTVLEAPHLVVFANYNQMYTCEPDHTNLNYVGVGRYPCISQNNNIIVYCDNSTYNIRAKNVDGTNDRLVATGSNRYPTVSADGSVIAFYDSVSPPHCFRVNSDGTNLVQISPNDGANWQYAAVSGDASTIVFFKYTSPYSIYLCDGDGTNPRELYQPGYSSSPAITYDAAWVYYHTPFAIRRIRTNGTGDMLVIGCSATSRFAMTPDGSKVAYTQYYSGSGNDLGVYDVVSGIETRLTFTNRNAGTKTLTVDGEWIVTDGFATGGMYSIKTDGSGSIFDWGSGDDPSCHGSIGEHY